MTRRTVLVELDRRSAVVSGPRLRPALQVSGARWHWHEHGRHNAVRVHLADLDDLLAALEVDGQHVEVLDWGGRPVPHGGLLGTGTG